MANIAIMTDTNSGISPEEAAKLNVYMLKMPFFVDAEEFFEYGSLSYDEFFHRMSSGAEISTSQPSPGALCEMWDSLLETHDFIIYMPMSSALSGTYNTAKMLANDYDGKIFVVDNKRISITLRSAILDAINMKNQGLSAEAIATQLEKSGLDASIYIAVNTLEYLKKSGRVTATGAAIGTLLGIKPVLQIQGEKLDAYKKVRGMPAAIQAMVDGIKADLENRFSGKKIKIDAAYSGNYEQASTIISTVKEHFPDAEVDLFPLPISISCHVGPGAFGIGVFEVLR